MAKNKLLEAEIKKFRMLSEYSFRIPDNYMLDEDEEAGEEEPEEGMPEPEAGIEGEEEVDLSFDGEPIEPEGEDEMSDEPEADDMGEPEMDDLPEPEGDIDLGDETPEAGPEMESGEEEIELDVTALVDKSEEATEASEAANEKLGMLMQKFAELEQRMPRMDMLGKKLEDLQKDIAKRNPTEVEKLEMRSLSSFPYSVKLSDFWEEKEAQNGKYDAVSGDEPEEKEYVLTKDDVDSDYSEGAIRNSFDYTEEDI